VKVDPTSWGERTDMTVEIGLGASGAEHEREALQQLAPMFEQVIAMQGGPKGPIVTLQNAYNLLKRMVEKSGVKSADPYVTDPSTQPQHPAGPPPPNPDMVKAQGQLQLEQQKAQGQLQLEQQKSQAQLQADAAQAQQQFQLDRYKADLDAQLRREQMQAEIALKREQMGQELQMKRELAAMGAMGMAPPSADDQVHLGGEPG
jgi:hypothetical protein